MSPLKQMLAGFGIGAAQVSTQLHNPTLAPGDTLSGTVEIRGGSVAQRMTDLVLTIETDYKREINDSTVWQSYVLGQQRLSDAFVAQPGERVSFPFALTLPGTTPLSIGGQQVRLRTRLALPNALDPTDTDTLMVQPHARMSQVFQALETLGFRMARAECSYSRRASAGLPFVQEFEFRPASGYCHPIEEIELIFQLHAAGLELLLEIDRRERGLAGMLADAYDLNERVTRLQLPLGPIDQQALVQQLDSTIREAARPIGLRW